MVANWINPPLRVIALLFLIVMALPFGMLFKVYRTLVQIIVKLFYPTISGILSAEHAAFALRTRVNAPMNIMLIVIFDGLIKVDKLQKDFQDRILSLTKKPEDEKIYKKLQYSYVHFMGYPFWQEEENFSIGEHIRKYDYQGTLALTSAPSEQDLENVAGELLKRPWSPDRSPWEILLVENYQGLRQSTFIFRINHALCDGLSLIKLAEHLFKIELPLPPIKMSKRTGVIRPALKIPLELGRIVFADAAKQRLGLGEPGGKNKVLFGRALSVDLIKSVKNHFEVSYAAVLYSALSGAIARVLQESNVKVPEIFNCRISLPKPNHPGGMSNQVIVPAVELPLKVAVPTVRLKLTQEKIVETSGSLLPIMNTQIGLWLAALFPTTVLESCVMSLPFPLEVYSTVVPTTVGQLCYDGVELVDLIPVASCAVTVGITAVFAGVNNQQKVAFSVDPSCFPSVKVVEKIAEYFNDEIDILARSVEKSM